jgi:hypothetical protein
MRPSVCRTQKTGDRVPCPAGLDEPGVGYVIDVDVSQLKRAPEQVLHQLGPSNACVCSSHNRRSPIVACSTLQLYNQNLLFPGCS